MCLFSVRIVKDIPKQRNGYDCGVFLLAFMKYIVLRKQFNFQTENMPYLRALFQKEILGNQIGTDISLPEISKSPNEPSIKKEFKQYETGECLLDSNVVGDTVRKPPAFLNRNLTMCWLNSIAQFLLLTLTDDGPNSNLKRYLVSIYLNHKYL